MKYSTTTASAQFKDVYGKRSQNAYNSSTVTEGRIKKTYEFVGKRKLLDCPLSFSGGVGSGSLPVAGVAIDVNPIISSKKVYGRVEIDREAIKAADGDRGSFVKQTKHSVQKCVESYNRNVARAFWNSYDNGMLGKGDGSTTVTGDGSETTPYLVIIDSSYWKEANWEEQDYVNVGTETTTLRIKAVVPSTRQIKLVGTSATLAAAVAAVTFTAAKIYMQGSKDNDPTSFMTVVAATSSTLYSVDVQRRWQAPVQSDSAGSGITTDMLNADILEYERANGKQPSAIIASYVQYRKILNLLEDKKEYSLSPRDPDLKKAGISFKGVEFMSNSGPIPIFPERFLDNDKIAYPNFDFIERHHRPDFGWFDDDGTVFLRKGDDDAYEARYGGYFENMIEPGMQGYRYSLAT